MRVVMLVWKLVAYVIVTALLAAHASAQTYPSKVLRMMVAFSAGSGTDTVGRIMATGMSEMLGQQIVVENRAGAAGNIGAELAAKAPADGYTLFLANISYAA